MKYARLLFIPFLSLLMACGSNPFKSAENVEQEGDALYGSYVIAKERGAVLLADPTIPDTAKRPVAVAMVDSKPVGDAGQDALIAYSQVRSEIDAGKSSNDKLVVAAQRISTWIASARPVIDRLVAAVRGLVK